MAIRSAFSQYDLSSLQDIGNLKKLLTIPNPEHAAWSRWGNHFVDEPEKELTYYRLTRDGKMWVPRNTLLHHPEYFKSAIFFDQLYGDPFELEWTGELRGYQETYMNRLTPDDWRIGDLLMEVPCGHGKTILGVFTTCRHALATLVLVPTYEIAEQWMTAFKAFSDIQEDEMVLGRPTMKADVLNKLPGVFIMTFELFEARKDIFTEGFCRHWGHVILDEAHRVGAPTYQPVLEIIPSKCRTALTATFRRSDGMAKILSLHFGKRYTMANQHDKPTVYAVKTGIRVGDMYDLTNIVGGKKNHSKNRAFFERCLPLLGVTYKIELTDYLTIDLLVANVVIQENDFDRKIGISGEEWILLKGIFRHIREAQDRNMSLVDSYCGKLIKRNRILLDAVRRCIDAGRTVIFIGKRKEPLRAFHQLFERMGYESCLVLGGKANDLKEKRDTAQVFWGIQQKAREGLDIERVDTLILHQPMSDIEQPCGRINRILTGKKAPLVCFPWDDYNPYKFLFGAAKKVTRNVDFVQTPITMEQFLQKIY